MPPTYKSNSAPLHQAFRFVYHARQKGTSVRCRPININLSTAEVWLDSIVLCICGGLWHIKTNSGKGIWSRWVLDCRTADLCTGMDGDLLYTGKSYFSYRLHELAFIVLSQMTRATLSKHFFFLQVLVIRNIWNLARRKYVAKLGKSK